MDNKLKCPRCSKSDYSVQNQGGSKNTFFHCKSCGYSASPEAWQKQQMDKNSSVNPFYKKSQKNDHAYNEMYPESGPWNNCKCGRDYQVGISGDSRFCETCLRQEEMKNRIRTKKSPLAKNNPFYKKSQLDENENLNNYFQEMKD
jgi:transcription elongation factor Elf1